MSGEVMLVHTTGGIFMPTFGEVAHTHVAIHAAKHKELIELLREATFLRERIGKRLQSDPPGYWDEFCDRIDAAFASLGGRPT